MHHAIHDDWRGFITTAAVEVDVPGESELADVLVVDLFQEAEALFAVDAAVAHPIGG